MVFSAILLLQLFRSDGHLPDTKGLIQSLYSRFCFVLVECAPFTVSSTFTLTLDDPSMFDSSFDSHTEFSIWIHKKRNNTLSSPCPVPGTKGGFGSG